MDFFIVVDLCVINLWKVFNSEYCFWFFERFLVRFIVFVFNDIVSDRFFVLNMFNSVNGGELLKVKGLFKWEEWIVFWKFWDQ